MSDDPKKKHLDSFTIDIHEPYELKYNAEKYGITQDELKRIVGKVGKSRAHIEAELRALGKL